MGKRAKDTLTGDLFDVTERFPIHAPRSMLPALDMKAALARAMGEAVAESGKTRPMIAAIMSELLGDDEVTGSQLYAYTAESRTSHTISIVRWIAFVRATGATWLWEMILAGEGLTVLQGAEALHAQASLAEKRGQELLAQAKQLRREAPIQVPIRRGAKV
jgi:hypothetical protein